MLRVIIICILLFLAASAGSALAADAVANTDPSSLLDAARSVFEAVMHGQWWAAAALGVILACAAARKYLPASWKAGTKGDIVGTAMAFVLAFAGAIATWAMAPGAMMSFAVVLTALKVGTAAVGGYTIVHKVAAWLAAWGKLPVWAAPILKLLAGLVGSDAVAKAEAAGAAAVAAKPGTGLAGDEPVREVP